MKRTAEKEDDYAWSGYEGLACAVIASATDCLKTKPVKDARRMRIVTREQDEAREFLNGGEGSMFDLWCSLAGVNRDYIKEQIKRRTQ